MRPLTDNTAESESSGAEITRVSWAPSRDIEHREWLLAGHKLSRVAKASQWWIGDWIRYGAARWGERYAEAARITGYDPATLRNIAWVSGQFDLSLRSDRLTWSHYAVLAPLAEAEKREWIERAITDRLSLSSLRQELRARRRVGRLPHVVPRESRDDERSISCPRCGAEIALSG